MQQSHLINTVQS